MLNFECWMKNEFVDTMHFHSKNNQNPKQPVFQCDQSVLFDRTLILFSIQNLNAE